MTSTALLTDHYELTMLQAALRSGVANHRSAFEVFARRLPPGRRFGIVGGIGRLAERLAGFRFGDDEIEFLRSKELVDEATIDWLADFFFSGNIRTYAEGDAYFPYSPVLSVDATFGEGVILETLILSILNHDSAIASAAARMKLAAGERGLIEAGSRRTHEEAAVACARIAYICGFEVTSNLESNRRYGVPSGGTSAHAFVLAHASERQAFEEQVRTFGPQTTFLVDTFEIKTGIATAVEVAQAAGGWPGAVRIDSGDLKEGCAAARKQLDRLGAVQTRIVASGDLDEFSISDLSNAPIDRLMVGTQLVTGSGAPTAGFVYKLVAHAETSEPDAPLVAVAKRAALKPNLAGRKFSWRKYDDDGTMESEWFSPDGVLDEGVALQQPLITAGVSVAAPALADSRAKCAQTLTQLPDAALSLDAGEPAITAALYKDQ